MVLKNKRERDRVKTSGLANKRIKQEYKGHRKTNYKKKKNDHVECSICYEKVNVCKDNTITCGKSNHTICGDCKIRMKDDSCPMCRSHSVKQPISQEVLLNIPKKLKKPKSRYTLGDMNPKQLRNFYRKRLYKELFGKNTNRLVRQRKNATEYSLNNWIKQRRIQRRRINNENRWLSNNEVYDYNAGYNIDTSSDTSEDTLSTLSLTDSDTILGVIFTDDEWTD